MPYGRPVLLRRHALPPQDVQLAVDALLSTSGSNATLASVSPRPADARSPPLSRLPEGRVTP